jgi:hypothetical protein
MSDHFHKQGPPPWRSSASLVHNRADHIPHVGDIQCELTCLGSVQLPARTTEVRH